MNVRSSDDARRRLQEHERQQHQQEASGVDDEAVEAAERDLQILVLVSQRLPSGNGSLQGTQPAAREHDEREAGDDD